MSIEEIKSALPTELTAIISNYAVDPVDLLHERCTYWTKRMAKIRETIKLLQGLNPYIDEDDEIFKDLKFSPTDWKHLKRELEQRFPLGKPDWLEKYMKSQSPK